VNSPNTYRGGKTKVRLPNGRMVWVDNVDEADRLIHQQLKTNTSAWYPDQSVKTRDSRLIDKKTGLMHTSITKEVSADA
jgi:hypothetical protein